MNQSKDLLLAICSSPWIGAEGSRNGQTLLIRARYIPDAFLAPPSLPHLLVPTYSYQPSDNTGLPSQDQYERIASFESGPIDAMEEQRIGVAMVIRTGSGSVRYFCYVRNIDEAVAAISERLHGDDPVEFAGDSDPTWAEYRRLTGMIAAWPTELP